MNVTALRRSRLGDQRLVLAAAIAVLAVIRALLILDAFHTQHDSGDIGRYQEIVTGGVPYRAQAVEYPPIAVLILEALHLIAPQRDAFGFAVITTMVLAEAALCVLIWRQFGRGPGFVFVALDTLLYAILLPRIDVLPTLFAAVFVASLGTRPVTAATAWVAAVGTKLWPLALAPLVLARRQGRVRTVVVASVGVVALVIGWAVVGGVTAFIDVVTYRGAKGWEIESVIGSVVRAVTGAVVQQQQGAARIGVVPPILGPALLAAGAAAGLLLCILAARAGRPGTGWLAAVLCLLVTSTLLSPQFFVWAAPAAALALFESRASAVAAVAFAVACAMTTAEYNFFTPLHAGVAAAQALVILRNAVCLVALGLAVRAVIGVPPQRRSAEAQ